AAWSRANGCSPDHPEQCPSPIIVASAGGASRAAFMTGSALGLLLDASCLDEEHQQWAGSKVVPNSPNPTSCAEAPAFGRRLFAISSVSGGSLGAVVYARSYLDGGSQSTQGPRADGGRNTYAPPCGREQRSDLWFRHAVPLGWRECLQAILAEDFLSPVFGGL